MSDRLEGREEWHRRALEPPSTEPARSMNLQPQHLSVEDNRDALTGQKPLNDEDMDREINDKGTKQKRISYLIIFSHGGCRSF